MIRIPSDQKELLQLRAEGLPAESTEQYYLRQVESIRNEIGIMQQFVGYSNIVSYEDHSIQRRTGEFGWDVLIRMELLTPLSEYMSRHALTEKEVLCLGTDISQALMICHGAGLIHRDIKPHNIFINALGFYKLGDFGISRALPHSSSELSFKGSIAYMAPETFSMRNTDMRSDIYSLALVLYRCLNGGREPFLSGTGGFTQQERDVAQNRRMNGEPVPRPERGSEALCRVITKALSYDPDARFQTAGQFRDALLQVEGGSELERQAGHFPHADTVSRTRPLMSGEQEDDSLSVSFFQDTVPFPAEEKETNADDRETTRELRKKDAEMEPSFGAVAKEPHKAANHPVFRQGSLEPAQDLIPDSGNGKSEASRNRASEPAGIRGTNYSAKKETAAENRRKSIPEGRPASDNFTRAVSARKVRRLGVPAGERWRMAVIAICLAAAAAVFFLFFAGRKAADVTQMAAGNLSEISLHASKDAGLRLAHLEADAVSTVDRSEITFQDPVLGEAIHSALQITGRDITVGDLREVKELTLEIAESDKDGKISGLEDLLLFPALESLTMRDCGLEDGIDFSVLQKLPELSHLDLHKNGIINLTAFQGMEKLSYLDLSKNKITDVSPLEGISSLESLALYHNSIETIEPLAVLTGLRELYLDENKIRDLSPLRGMMNLQVLRLDDNKIEEVTPLQPLTRLESLDLENNRIKDITPLGTLTSLTELWIGKNQIEQIGSLQNLVKLQYISFGNNKVSDLTPLQKISSLRELAFSDNAVTDLSPLKDLTSLTYLEADDNKFSQISSLKGMKKLEALYLNGNEITDPAPLKDLSQLKILALGENKIENISSLKELTALESLDLYSNLIADISGLNKMTKLIWLNVGDNHIKDLSPVKNMKTLETLQAYQNEIKDLAPVKDLTALRFIEMDSNSISDLSALKSLSKLERLYIEYNQVTDVTPLQNLMGLKMIYLAGNNISDYASLNKLKDAGAKIFKESQYD